jgi:homoserine dehydrogenase
LAVELIHVLTRNAAEITRRTGVEIKVVQVADRNIELAKKVTGGNVDITDDAFATVSNPNVDVVVELIGGYTLSKQLVLKAIENGKHVVTANKALIALHGNEIFAARTKSRCDCGI